MVMWGYMIHKQVIVYIGSSVLQRVPSELQECYCSLLPGSGRSSMLAGLIAWRKSSTPSSLQVSVYALSDRHLGQVHNWPFGPPYQASTQSSHPIMLLQHRAKIIGGFIGEAWQMLHLNVSSSMRRSPTGTFIHLLISNRACMSCRISFTSVWDFQADHQSVWYTAFGA